MKYKKTIKKRFRKKKRSNKSKKYGGSSQQQILSLELEPSELERKIIYWADKLAQHRDYLVKTEQYIEEIKRKIQTLVDQLGNNETLDINPIRSSSIESRVLQQLRLLNRLRPHNRQTINERLNYI